MPPDRLPSIEKKLVLNSFISPQEDTIRVMISESNPIFTTISNDLNNNQYSIINKAEVSISSKGKTVKIPLEKKLGLIYAMPAKSFPILAGETYEIMAKNGERFIKATCTVPKTNVAVKEITFDTLRNATNNFIPAYLKTKVKISWDDPLSEDNYYLVNAFIFYEITSNGITKSENRSLYFKDGNLLKNSNLNGSSTVKITGDLDIFPSNFNNFNDNSKIEIKWIEVKLASIEKELFDYYKSLNNFRSDNPFVEPTPVYSNIVGGLGIFGAENSTTKRVNF